MGRFISYASEDREAVAAPLARLLEHLGLRVWFDQKELKVGDSLRERIDDGLGQSRYGVVVLSNVNHYNAMRPHRTLALDSPLGRVPAAKPGTPSRLARRKVLGGLHSEYRWVA